MHQSDRYIDNIYYDTPEFSRLWHHPAHPLSDMNAARVPYFLAKLRANLDSPWSSKRILDVGCGGGIMTERIAQDGGFEVTGIDLSPRSAASAEKHAADAGVQNVRYMAG